MTYIDKFNAEDVTEKFPALWNLLTPEEHRLMVSSLQFRSYKKYEYIYRVGESPDSPLFLLSGKVKIFCDGVGGRSQIMRMMSAGQYFGYRAFLAREPYVTAAAAFEPTTLGLIPMTVVSRVMEHNNQVCRFFISELATDLGIADRRTVSLTQKHVRGRLAESLLFLLETYGKETGSGNLKIHLSREDLANLSNMTTSNAIRTLSAFSAEGLIALDGRDIRILDEPALDHISRMG